MNIEKKIREIARCALSSKETGLFTGKMGIAIFYFYYARFYSEAGCYDQGLALVNEVMDRISCETNGHTFCTGTAGVCWGLIHLVENDFVGADVNYLVSDMDAVLYRSMMYELDRGNWDFLHGASGICFYFIKRHRHKDMQQYLAAFITGMEQRAICGDDGSLKWESLIMNTFRGYNICLSHGMAALVAVFARLYTLDVERQTVRRLLNGAVTYILGQQLHGASRTACFPVYSKETSPASRGSRLAWCYGDLGIAAALLSAGKTTGDGALTENAIEILKFSLQRNTLAGCGIVDAGICHGAAGVGHIYNRIYRHTGLSVFREAAHFWFNEALNLSVHNDGRAGYKVWRSAQYGGWCNEDGLLEGTAGIGLALLSAISEAPPYWDECLLIS